jgi:hypothetical protein
VVDVTFERFAGDAHGGLTRSACSRLKLQHPIGGEVRNSRQVGIVSAEEVAEIAAALDLDAPDPRWLGASMVAEGAPQSFARRCRMAGRSRAPDLRMPLNFAPAAYDRFDEPRCNIVAERSKAGLGRSRVLQEAVRASAKQRGIDPVGLLSDGDVGR